MKITQEADYGLRVVAYLSKLGPGAKLSANIISEKQNIPLRFLLKLLQKLRDANIVESFMGVKGGYALKKAPSEITLKDVIEAIEGPIYLNRCLEHPEECNNEGPEKCPVHKTLEEIQENFKNDLDSVSFQDIIDRCKE